MNTSRAICRLRAVMRRQPKALSTEQTYIGWLRRYMTALRELPEELSSEKNLEQFLTDLARRRGVSAAIVRCPRSPSPQTTFQILVTLPEDERTPAIQESWARRRGSPKFQTRQTGARCCK